MKFSVFQLSRRGGRAKNEDRMGYCYTREAALLVLADGMGGHPEGEVAAQMALQTVSALFQKEARPVVRDVHRFLSNAVLAAHHQIIRYADSRGMPDAPRSTLVVALVQNGKATWAHCGDSRLYCVRQGILLARTVDHSLVERRPAVAVQSIEPLNRNVLYTCLGSPGRPQFDVSEPLQLQEGDKIMLCSDGLWDPLDESQLVRQLANQPVADAVPLMVAEALQAGGRYADNTTVLAMEWETPDDQAAGGAISTDSISDEVFASTIQAGGPGVADDTLDNEEIERAIAEINEAIRRSAAKKA